jgi:benzoyl-CoA reductase/2-hydroxyglutaryl-CoA dehydratase subunit BcrC/BadD/HgdB
MWKDMPAPGRAAYIEIQRRDQGRTALGVLPVHYPKALCTAMDVLAVEIWGPPGPPRAADAGRIQPYVCAVVRNALAFLASGGADAVDAVLFPHTCDSIQGLASLAPDLGGWSKPALRFIHPRGGERDSARRMLRAELEAFAGDLARLRSHPLEPERLAWAIALHQQIDAHRRTLLEQRRRFVGSDRALYQLLRRGEWLWPEEHLAELQAAVAALAAEPVAGGVPLLVTGYVPEPMALLDHLGAAGARLVADDYAAVGRRLPIREVATAADPLQTLVDLTFALPPCPTLAAAQAHRLAHLERLWRESGAAGVIIHEVKFCEPELFDVPAIQRHFGALGVPVLLLEGELEVELSGQTQTRVEAFVELVAARREAA